MGLRFGPFTSRRTQICQAKACHRRKLKFFVRLCHCMPCHEQPPKLVLRNFYSFGMRMGYMVMRDVYLDNALRKR